MVCSHLHCIHGLVQTWQLSGEGLLFVQVTSGEASTNTYWALEVETPVHSVPRADNNGLFA